MEEQVNGSKERREERVDGQKNRWLGGRQGGDGWMRGWMDDGLQSLKNKRDRSKDNT